MKRMLEHLKKNNPELPFFSVHEAEFKTFGRVLDLDTRSIVQVGEQVKMPEGVSYTPSLKAFEELPLAAEIKNRFFGSLPAQIGYCYGHNRMLNATEWHTCNELNIAVTDLVLLLGHVWEIEKGLIDASRFKAFYLPKGTAVEVYSTSLHYCPCQVSDDGFRCVVGLLTGTNTALQIDPGDLKLTAKNKWLIAHIENTAAILKGVVPGITGTNFEVRY